MESQEHKCSQEASFATICNQLKNIESDIKEIKDGQKTFMDSLTASLMNSAKYPSPDFVNKQISKLDKHETYFKIIGTALLIAWGLLLFLVDKVWR